MAEPGHLEPLAVSVPEAGRLLGVSERQAWHLVKQNAIPTVRLGGRRVVAVAELRAILDRGGIPLGPDRDAGAA